MRSFARSHEATGTPHAADGRKPQRDHPLLGLQRAAGNQAVQRMLEGGEHEVPHRTRMEQAFGTDFSSVRVHRGARAALDPLGANAATSGEHVAFASAEPDPRVVAHELAHVVQQRRGRTTGDSSSHVVDSPHLEAEADSAAASAAGGRRVPSLVGAARGIQCDKPKPKPKTPSPILYVGVTENAPDEVKKLSAINKDRGGVTAITTTDPQDVIQQGGVNFNLWTKEGVENFVKTLGLAADAETKAIALIQAQSADGRDEVAALIRFYAAAEANPGSPLMKRVVLSGHSGGYAIFGRGGRVGFDQLVTLAQIFPNAAGQVEHLHMSGCSTGGESTMERYYLKAFPNVKTIWAYAGACPTDYGAVKAIETWEGATEKPGVNTLVKQADVAVWSGGKYKGSEPLPLHAAIDQVNAQDSLFIDYFEGTKADSSHESGPLTTYYRQLVRVAGRSGLTDAERTRLQDRQQVALRLRHYTNVRVKFMAAHGTTVKSGYESLKLPMPDYATLSRKDAVAAVRAFGTAAAGGGDAAMKALALLQTLENLAPPAAIPEQWILD